jgi:hypothetical protein
MQHDVILTLNDLEVRNQRLLEYGLPEHGPIGDHTGQ